MPLYVMHNLVQRNKKNVIEVCMQEVSGTPGGIRTPDTWYRKPVVLFSLKHFRSDKPLSLGISTFIEFYFDV